MDLDPSEIRAIITRMKRANGHLASVIRMMEEGSGCSNASPRPTKDSTASTSRR